MLTTLLLCGLTLGPPNALPTAPLATAALAASAQTPPREEMLRLFNDMGALLRRALAEPDDAKALALLQGAEAARILKREQASEPVVTEWRQTLSAAERKAVDLELQNSETGKLIGSLSHDATIRARLERNPKLQTAVRLLLDGPPQK